MQTLIKKPTATKPASSDKIEAGDVKVPSITDVMSGFISILIKNSKGD